MALRDRLTKKQADDLYPLVEAIDPGEILDPLSNLTSDGESDDRQGDTQDARDALSDFVDDLIAMVENAKRAGLVDFALRKDEA